MTRDTLLDFADFAGLPDPFWFMTTASVSSSEHIGKLPKPLAVSLTAP